MHGCTDVGDLFFILHTVTKVGRHAHYIALTMLCGFMLATTAAANLLSADAEQVSASFVRQIEVSDFE